MYRDHHDEAEVERPSLPLLDVIRYLITRRWYYVLLGLVLAILAFGYLSDRGPFFHNTYTTSIRSPHSIRSIRLKAEDRGREPQNIPIVYGLQDTDLGYTPLWSYSSPFMVERLQRELESTNLVVEAGRKINYNVWYFEDNRNIYAQRPFDLYFLSSYGREDALALDLKLDADGHYQIVWSKLSGDKKGGKAHLSEPITLIDGERTATPIGDLLLVKRSGAAPIKKLRVERKSDLETQLYYDDNIDREQEDLQTVLKLQSPCSFEQADALFRSIKNTLEGQLRQEVEHNGKSFIQFAERALDSLKKSSPSNTALIRQLNRQIDIAKSDLTLLSSRDSLLLFVDPPYESQHTSLGNTFIWGGVLAFILVLFIPLGLLFIELAIAPRFFGAKNLSYILKQHLLGSISLKNKAQDVARLKLLLRREGKSYLLCPLTQSPIRCKQLAEGLPQHFPNQHFRISEGDLYSSLQEAAETNSTVLAILVKGDRISYNLERLSELLQREDLPLEILTIE